MKFFKQTLILFSLLLAFNFAHGQMDFDALSNDAGSSTMDQNYCLSLDTNEPLVEVYEFDISSLGFTSSEEATKVFNRISNNLVSYVVDFNNNRGFAKIYNSRIPDGEVGTVIWWNSYLSNLCNQQ